MHVLHRLLRWHFQLPRRFLELPWRETLTMFRQRFREDHLALTASSLTLGEAQVGQPGGGHVSAVLKALALAGAWELAWWARRRYGADWDRT